MFLFECNTNKSYYNDMFDEKEIIKRQAQLILNNSSKLPCTLGIRENICVQICQIQKSLKPKLTKPVLLIAAADSEVTDEKDCIDSQNQTLKQILNFANNCNVSSIVAQQNSVDLNLCNVGIKSKLCENKKIKNYCLMQGARNPVYEKALNKDVAKSTFINGINEVKKMYKAGHRVVLLGEIGIGITEVSSLLTFAFTRIPLLDCIDQNLPINVYEKKVRFITDAIHRHGKLKSNSEEDIFDCLTNFGGLEIIFLAGAIVAAEELNMLTILDGIITATSYLIACTYKGSKINTCIASTKSSIEPQNTILEMFCIKPIMDLGLALGEGSGSLFSYPLLCNSIFLFNNLNALINSKVKVPFPIGTTSNIFKSDILENVQKLKTRVDDIELTLFESMEEHCYPPKFVIRELIQIAKEENLTYTIHLPYDVNLGNINKKERTLALNNYIKMINRTKALPIHGYIIHLVYDENNLEKSLQYIKEGMKELISKSGIPSTAFCVETLSQPFNKLQSIIKELNLSITIDIGHLYKNNFYSDNLINSLLPYTRIIHFHGCKKILEEESDIIKNHQSITNYSKEFLNNLYSIFQSNQYLPIVITIEVFQNQFFEESIKELTI